MNAGSSPSKVATFIVGALIPMPLLTHTVLLCSHNNSLGLPVGLPLASFDVMVKSSQKGRVSVVALTRAWLSILFDGDFALFGSGTSLNCAVASVSVSKKARAINI